MHTRTRTHKYKWINGRVLEIEYMRVFFIIDDMIGVCQAHSWPAHRAGMSHFL